VLRRPAYRVDAAGGSPPRSMCTTTSRRMECGSHRDAARTAWPAAISRLTVDRSRTLAERSASALAPSRWTCPHPTGPRAGRGSPQSCRPRTYRPVLALLRECGRGPRRAARWRAGTARQSGSPRDGCRVCGPFPRSPGTDWAAGPASGMRASRCDTIKHSEAPRWLRARSRDPACFGHSTASGRPRRRIQ
jgi:hypothetical protein